MSHLVSEGHRLYAFLRGESEDSPESLLAEAFRGHLTDGLPLGLGGDYVSRSEMIEQGWGGVGQHFAMAPEVDELYAVNEGLMVARGHYVGHGVATGKPVRAAFAHFWTHDGSRFSSVYQVTDTAAWSAALPESS
ncbi:MAG: nuclear transport factor 2 family protein [Kineosporiaceae bacterium]